jgi:hypothetical protein
MAVIHFFCSPCTLGRRVCRSVPRSMVEEFILQTISNMEGLTMKKEMCVSIFLSLCMLFVIGLSGCGDDGDNNVITFPMTLVDRNVMVAGGGGFFDVPFSAGSGQQIRIILTAISVSQQISPSSMAPYSYLAYPDGTGVYYPPVETAQNGQNFGELTLNQTGSYRLTIFDGSNLGGTINVKIERLS